MDNGYSICFNKWALDKEIKNELGLLLMISSLCAETGYCYASNDFFAKMFDTNEITISRKIKLLESKGYITIEYEKRGCEIKKRYIRLTKLLIDDYQKCKSTINKNVKENNISINNIKENNNINIITKEKMKKPTLEEIENYIKDKNINVNAKTFYDYFTTSNWIDSKGNKVKNWKQKLITWNSYNKKQETFTIKTPNWFVKDNDITATTLEEKNEIENILKEIGE